MDQHPGPGHAPVRPEPRPADRHPSSTPTSTSTSSTATRTGTNTSPPTARSIRSPQANPLLNQSLGESSSSAQQTAYTLVNDGQIFDQVFGSAQASRVRPVLGGQAAWDRLPDATSCNSSSSNSAPPSQYIYSMAVAPYFAIDNSANVPGLTLDQLFAALDQGSEHLPPVDQLQRRAGAAVRRAADGLRGRPGPGPQRKPGRHAAGTGRPAACTRSYLEMMQDWRQVGGGIFDAYQLTGRRVQLRLLGDAAQRQRDRQPEVRRHDRVGVPAGRRQHRRHR